MTDTASIARRTAGAASERRRVRAGPLGRCGRGPGGAGAAIVCGLATALSLAAIVPPAFADEPGSALEELTPAADEAIERGLQRLVELQDRTTGCVGDRFRVASTSLGGLALLSAGDQAGRGVRASAVEGAIRYLLLDTVKRPGGTPGSVLFHDGLETQGKMHAHGFATLFLAEAYGSTSRDDEIREAIRGAIVTTLRAQTARGGWGYYVRGEAEWGTEGQDEASVTITQIQALRAARNAGFSVPAEAIKRAVGYVRACMTRDGSCRYSLTMGAEGARTSFELTAAAVSTLNASGVYEGSEELERGLGYLEETLARYATPDRAATDFYFYGNLYAAQAFFQAGGRRWQQWYPAVRRSLLERQKPSGGWESPRNFGEAYATASAVLILNIPRRLLPIFQR